MTSQNHSKLTRKQLILFIVLLTVGVTGFIVFTIRQIFIVGPVKLEENKKFNEEIYENFNVSFGGIVTNYQEDRKMRGDHFGIVQLDLSFTDQDHYDPSDSTDVFFCKIKHGKAYVIVPVQYKLEYKRGTRESESIQSGDSLVYNGQTDKFKLYFNRDSATFNPWWFLKEGTFRNKAKYLP